MWIQNPVDIIILVVACEALVHLWFHAAPLQPARDLLVRLTPFLYSDRQGKHLLNCAYCMSVWIGFFVVGAYIFLPGALLVCGALAVHRLSNFLHLVFSLMRDKQFDLRVARK